MTESNKNDIHRKLKIKFLELISGKEKKVSEATEIIVKYILDENKIYTTKEDVKSEVWIYREGIYTPQGRSEIKEIMRNILDEWYNNYFYYIVISKIEADTFIESQEFFMPKNLNEICVKNGILDIFTRELKPYTSDKIFFNKMPVIYDKNKKCPMIDVHLSEVLKNPGDKIVFYEIVGYCLEQTHFIEKAFMFVGDGRNGKGKSLELIKRLVGIEGCSSVPLALMTPDSFNLHQLYGKKANLAGDLSNTDLKDLSLFKSLVGRDIITAHRKFMTDLIFTSTCKHIFACNELPKVYDMSKGFWDRWLLLEFPYTFVSQQEYNTSTDEEKKFKKIINPNHIDKICTEDELSGLLNSALDGLDRLRKNKDFSYTIGSKEIKDIWIRKSNSFTAFCYDCISEKEGEHIVKSDLRKYYNQYRKNFGNLKGAGDKEIKATLEDLYGVGEGRKDIQGEWVNIWTGIVYQGYQGKIPYRGSPELSLGMKNPGNPGSNTPPVVLCSLCNKEPYKLNRKDRKLCLNCFRIEREKEKEGVDT